MRILGLFARSFAFFYLKKGNCTNPFKSPLILNYDIKPSKKVQLPEIIQDFSFTNVEKQLQLIQSGKQNITSISMWVNETNNKKPTLTTKLSSIYLAKNQSVVGETMEITSELNLSSVNESMEWNYSLQLTKTGRGFSNIDENDNIESAQNKVANYLIRAILKPIINGDIKSPSHQRQHLNMLLKIVAPKKCKLDKKPPVSRIQKKDKPKPAKKA